MSGCQCDRAAVGAVCIRCFERRDDAADLRQQLAAAQAALTAEREAHEQTRALACQLGDLAVRGGRGSDIESDAYELLEKLEVPRG
jgi:hypothetical protein